MTKTNNSCVSDDFGTYVVFDMPELVGISLQQV